MSEAEVKCINKNDRHDPTERITHVGGHPGSNSPRWKWTLDHAIQEIESGRWNLYVDRGGSRVRIVVARSKFGNKYLKTEADGEAPNNLLSLPECP